MPGPLIPLSALNIAQLGLGAAGVGAGLLANRFRPKVPDLSSAARARFTVAQDRLDSSLDARMRQVDDRVAARGGTGSAGVSDREALIRQGLAAQNQLSANEADAVIAADNQEKLLRYQDRVGRFDNTVAGIGNLLSNAGNLIALRDLFGDGEAVGEETFMNLVDEVIKRTSRRNTATSVGLGQLG